MKRYIAVLVTTLLFNSTGLLAADGEVIADELAPPVRVQTGTSVEAPAIPETRPTLSILNTAPVIENPPPVVTAYSIEPARMQVSRRDVDYRFHRGGSKERFCREDMKETCLVVKDPCDPCCELELPVCIPCCCEVPCSVKCSKGLFGRTITEYCWDCGFRMEVVATKHGEFIVHHYGVK